MIAVSNLSVQFGGVFLFENVSFQISPTDKVGLVGKNGAGKSTLLKIISGKQTPEGGNINMPKGHTIGYLTQDIVIDSEKTVFEETKSAFSDILEIDNEIAEITKQLEERTDYESDGYYALIEQLNHCTERQTMISTDNIDGDIEKVLQGLGFSRKDFSRNIQEFSGGWKMRVELAKILLRKPETILLDEPTNHLDIESIQWLEDYLKDYYGCVIMVSHDRAFLDAITKRTIEITLGKIEDYKVSYSKYVEQRAERRKILLASYENQQRQIEQSERFIERFKAKASKATQAQSRQKQLDKMDRIEIEPEDNAQIRFNFADGNSSGKVVMLLEHITKAYDKKVILQDVNLEIVRGDKVAFIGKNGEGKSTLSKIIVDAITFEGKKTIGHNVKIGYYAQNQSDTLDPNKTVFQTLDDVAVGDIRLKIRTILGAFLFTGESIDKKVKVLSGGEKGRLAMAKLLLEPYNLLVLDEPTNHLDMKSKDVLKNAINDFTGTVVIVSHDREFLDGLCNKIYHFKNQQIKEHLGTLQEFLEKNKMESLKEIEANKQAVVKQVKENKPAQTSSPDKQLKNQLSKIESTISELELKLKTLETELAKNSNDTLIKEYTDLKSNLDTKLLEWEELSMKTDFL